MTTPGPGNYPGPDNYPALDNYPGAPPRSAPRTEYVNAIRSGYTEWTTVMATYQGLPAWPTSLQVTGGTVTDDATPGVRSTLDNLQIVAETGLDDALSPIGTQLAVTHVLRYPSGATEKTPHGVFDIDVQRLSVSTDGRTLTLTAPDKWVRIKRARFLAPQRSNAGTLVTDQIISLLRGALGLAEPVNNYATSTATVGALVWETDRDKAIIDLADSVGACVYFDRSGVATIRDMPTIGRRADWLIDASASGILLSADRELSRQRTYNVVKVSSSQASDVPPFDPQYAWDSDPSSATYAGSDPVSALADPAANPSDAGPFGIVPYFYDTPVISDPAAAQAAARSILYRVTGLASQLTLTSVKNPKIDALDVIDVLLPPEGASSVQATQRHIVDRVTHPLMPTEAQQITTRSTRADAYQ
jgi:hypothetical protein